MQKDIILVVEDDKNLVITLKSVLEEQFDVRTTVWGTVALEDVKNGIPDLVLLDIMLPGMNGMQVLEGMQKYDSKLPIIMITGYGCAETAAKAMRLGAVGYINKPFDYEELIQKIRYALRSSRRVKRGKMFNKLKKMKHNLGDATGTLFNKK